MKEIPSSQSYINPNVTTTSSFLCILHVNSTLPLNLSKITKNNFFCWHCSLNRLTDKLLSPNDICNFVFCHYPSKFFDVFISSVNSKNNSQTHLFISIKIKTNSLQLTKNLIYLLKRPYGSILDDVGSW